MVAERAPSPVEPMPGLPLVAVVDDDFAVRSSLVRLLRVSGYEPVAYDGGQALLAALSSRHPDVAIIDLQMPGMSGLQLQAVLADRAPDVPVIFLSAYGTVPASVTAMRGGAVDFLEKPAHPEVLLDVVARAATAASERRSALRERDQARRRLEELTDREWDVLQGVVSGMSSKSVAKQLGLALQTVKAYRSRVLTKTGATSTAELVHLVDTAGGRPGVDA